MSILSLLLTANLFFFLGFHMNQILRSSRKRILQPLVKKIVTKEDLKETEEAKSILIEPSTALELAAREQEQRIKDLNPDE